MIGYSAYWYVSRKRLQTSRNLKNENVTTGGISKRRILFFIIILGITTVLMLIVFLLLTMWQQSLNRSSYAYPGNYDLSINIGGVVRNYRMHIPAAYDHEKPLPLVIVLHWFGGNPRIMEAATGFSLKADKENFIVVYPEGNLPDYSWNAGFCCGQALRNNVNDVEFIRRLVEKTMEDLKIDPKRIYVVGASNGGMMAHRLGAELSDIFAAIAVIAGSIGKDPDDHLIIPAPSGPVSVIIIHGKQDQLVPYYGGGRFGERFASISECVSFWVEANNCSSNPQVETSSDGNVVKNVYSGGVEGTEVVLYTIIDGDHSWSFRGISTTDTVWEFFKNHPKP
ncbi:MAG: PHB depolymerase family esterase [Thermoproteota archaeon]